MIDRPSNVHRRGEPASHEVADRESNVHQRGAQSRGIVADRDSNVHPRSGRLSRGAIADRESNAQQRSGADSVLTVELVDGPAFRRIRSANAYFVGQTITLRAIARDSDGRRVPNARLDGLVWAVEDRGLSHPIDGSTGTFVPTVAGDHWYRFDALDSAGDIIATAEKMFVVLQSRLPR